MALRENLDRVFCDQRLIHKEWMSRAVKQGVRPSEEAADLVWELLVDYGASVDDGAQTREDIYKSAYELAKVVLPNMSIGRALDIYRDALLDSMMETACDSGRGASCRPLVRFASLISTAFNEVNADTLKKAIRHQRAESLSNELRIAKSIQAHLLPKAVPVVPGFEFAGRLVAAQEVGGDYWSIKFYREDGIITMKLADITGHGIAAATLVAAVKFISGGYYRGSASASEVMRQTNRVLTRETPHDILVSMAYAWLKPETHEISIVNAGHEPVFLCSSNTCIDVYPTGPVLGVDESAQYSEQHFKLKKDDVVFFGSDGITEAGIGEQFGLGRLKEVVLGKSNLTADEIADNVIQAVTQYAGKPHDDLSMLVVRVTSDPDEATQDHLAAADMRI